MIKVLVVEDSAVLRDLLVHILGSDPQLKVVGTARDGEEAVEKVALLQPDVVTMDIHMPRLDGFDAARRIMESRPTPIVIVSGSSDPEEVATTFRAMEAGALAMLQRPAPIGDARHESTSRELVQTVKLMSEVRVVRRWPRRRGGDAVAVPPAPPVRPAQQQFRILAIGASTGGPPVLQALLAELPADFPLPTLVVQHMASGFSDAFAGWLRQTTRKAVHMAAHGEVALPGHVYIAPDGLQMKVNGNGTILLTDDDPVNGLRPSVSYLFRSVAEKYGKEAVAVILTGMGRDGAEELKLLRDAGALTFAQDQATSVVHGMPGEAIRLGAASYVLSPAGIAAALTAMARQRR